MSGVLGYLTQCAVCPQQAILAEQKLGHEWLCPLCSEVAEPEPESAPYVGPLMQHGDRVAVEVGGKLYTTTFDSDSMRPWAVTDPDPMRLAEAVLGATVRAAEAVAGFGDVDVAAAEAPPLRPADLLGLRPNKQKLTWQGRAALTFYVDPTEDPDLGSVQG